MSVVREDLARKRGVCCTLDPGIEPGRVAETAGLLKVLADPTRLSMVAALRRADGPVCVCDFTATYQLGQPTISHHMAKLRAAGLVESRKHGVWVYYRMAAHLPPAVERVLDAALGAA